MSWAISAALALDFEDFDDEATAIAPSAAMVRDRAGVLRPVDVARLAWPDESQSAGVDYVADLSRGGRSGSC